MLKKSAKIYITGGSGLVGRNIMENPDILNCCILAPKHSELDLMDYNSVLSFLKAEKPDIIIHTAGHVGGIKANMEDPYGFFTDNAVMGINVVRASKEAGVKNLLNLSSSCSYPCNISTPLKEDMIFTGKFEPTNEGYALAKICGIKLCNAYNRQYGTNYISVMPCNLYGINDNYHPENAHVIPMLIRRFHEAKLKGLKEVAIWGTGMPRREFLCSDDLANAVVYLMENKNKDDIKDGFINIGYGSDITIMELAELIKETVGFEGEIKLDKTKPDGTMLKLMDVSRMKEFGWEAKINLREGLKISYNDFLSRL